MFLIDAAQSAAHLPIDVENIGCDVLAFSGYKLGAPMGIGVLYGREELLERFGPFIRGGGMVAKVTENGIRWKDLPDRLEGGTPNGEGAVGLAAAIGYIQTIGFEKIRALEEDLASRALHFLRAVPGIKIFGPSDMKDRSGVISFAIDGIHPHDLATILDRDNICIRAGHHCAIPLHDYLGVPATARVSFWVYNTPEDVERLGKGVEQAMRILKA